MCALQIRGRHLAQQLECLDPLPGSEGANHQARGLPRNRLPQPRMSVAEAGNRDAREKIEVNISVRVGERRAFTMIECDTGEQRHTLSSGRDVTLFVCENLLRLG